MTDEALREPAYSSVSCTQKNRAAVDSGEEVVAGAAAAITELGAQRTAVDGTTGL
jgi:hypothetical protein